MIVEIVKVVMDLGGRNVGMSLFNIFVDDLSGGFVDVLFLVAFLSEFEYYSQYLWNDIV